LSYLLALADSVFDRSNKISVITFKQSSVSGPKAMNPGLAATSSFVLWYARDRSEWTPNRVFVPTKRDNRYNRYISNRSEHHSEWQLDTLRNAFAKRVGVSANELQSRFGSSLEQELEKFVLELPDRVVRLARVAPKDVNAEAREQLLKSQANLNMVYRAPRQDREDYGGR
jgi:adenine-specific DNA-methyltransferase